MPRSPALVRTMPFLIGWALSLCLPAIDLHLNASGEPMWGWAVLASGFLGMVALQFGWLANIALFGVLAGLSGRWMQGRWLLGWSILLLLTSLSSLDLFIRPAFWKFEGAGPGYWLWLLSTVGAALTGLVIWVRQGKMSR